MRFKYLDSRDFHIEDDDTQEEEYIIKFFGRTPLDEGEYSDKSICITVHGFTPFFFVKMPVNWSQHHAKSFFNKLRDEYKQKDLIQYCVRDKYDFDGFNGHQKVKFIQLIFRTANAMRKCTWTLSKPFYFNGKRNNFKLYESNIDPVLKLMHIKEISGCSWIYIDNENIEFTKRSTYCDIEGNVNWEDLHSSKTDNETGTYCRLRVLSYDIETMSSDTGFPQASREGDYVIQIGMTFNYYTQSDCYKKYLISLNTCDDIPETTVINCKTEKELLTKFVEIVKKEDPDILTGYNIFGFDNKYLYDRSKMCGELFAKKFSEWGRIKEPCNFATKNLSSSALGDNTLYFYESIGRVQIDLYKVIQRDYNLEMYKLDFVSSHFNQNTILNLTENTFETPNVSGLEVGGYFKIKMTEKLSGVEDFYCEEKYFVENIEGKMVTFSGPKININLDDYTMKWCMAKDDLPAEKLFKYWLIDSQHRQIIGKYCIKDCVLVNFLMEKLDIISTNMAMSYVCWVPLYYIFIRGQGIKAFSLVAQQCRKDNFLIPTIKKTDYTDRVVKIEGDYKLIEFDRCTNDKCTENLNKKVELREYFTGERVCNTCNRLQYYGDYEGARVYEPVPGVYWQPISVLDYASLYPRSIISRNMSWETQVLDPKYNSLADYKYYTVSYKDSLGKTIDCTFAQKKDGTLGIVPKILFNLLDERDATKKKMKKESDPFKKKILDGHQLALKITANSLYGQLGALTSPIYRKDIAACTTAVGQHMLSVAQDFMENKFIDECNKLETGADKEFIEQLFSNYTIEPKIIYGDSVTADTPILVKINNKVEIKEIQELFTIGTDYPEFKPEIKGKKEQSFTDYSVWTNGKWSKIKRVIRHFTDKKIYRVYTKQGIVDVTEDHSLLDNNITLLKPKECIVNSTKLLVNYPEFTEQFNVKKRMYFYNISIDIPMSILQSNSDTRFNYLRQYRDTFKESFITSSNKMIIAKWYYLLKSLNYIPHLRYAHNVYYLDYSNNYVDNTILKIESLGHTPQYVFDLETEDGVFQAGIGEIIVKNTDSVFTNFQLKNLAGEEQTDRNARHLCIKLGILAGKLVKPYLDYPHDLEYEKTFHPWLVICKKKYAGAKYEENPDKFSMNYMGIVLKRRDNAKIVKKVCGGILNILFKEKNTEHVVNYVKNMLTDIINDKFDITYFITTKKLSGTYKGIKLSTDRKGKEGDSGSWDWDDVKCGQAHVALCQRMKHRDPGSAPQVNDRISFVQIYNINDDNFAKKLQGEKIEEVSYVLENKLPIDYLYYIENQIENPSCQFLELIIDSPEKTIFSPIKNEIELGRKKIKMGLTGGTFKVGRNTSRKSKVDSKDFSPKTKRLIEKLKSPSTEKPNKFNINF